MKFFILLALVMTSGAVFGKTVARVSDISGNAFVFTESKKAKSLKFGDKIEDMSDVMVEDGSTLTLINKLNHEVYVTGGTLVKFYNGFSEVKNGQVWVKVNNSHFPGVFHTSNTIAKYGQGQFIYSFDNSSGKTQLLVLTGQVQFSNSLEPEVAINVPSGHFSFVEQSFEKSLPRAPTKVGLKSYKKFKSLFAGFETLRDTKIDEMLWNTPVKKKRSRSIASVKDQFSFGKENRGKLIKITTYKASRTPASTGPMEYYKNIKKKESLKRKPVKTNNSIKIKYHGFDWKKTTSVVTKPVVKKITVVPVAKKVTPLVQRQPASIGSSQSLINELSAPSEFEKSLQENAMKQKRHSKEVNSLIDDLKSYKQDYKKEY